VGGEAGGVVRTRLTGLTARVLPVVVTGALLCACSGPEDPPEDTAAQLAAALSDGKLPDGLFTGGSPQRAYDALLDGLDPATPTVEVTSVDEKEDTAVATLAWAWEVEGRRWAYESTADLTRAERWQVTWDPALVEPTLVAGERLVVDRTAAPRADVLGAGGRPLVTERPVLRYGIDKTKVSAARAAASARRAADLLGVAPAAFVKAVRAAGKDAFVEAIVLRPGDAGAVDSAYASVPGAVAVRDQLPLAPTREFAAPLLGRVGAATAELIEESDGRLRPGDVVGLSGLEQRYDEQLAGEPGVTVSAVGEDGGDPRELFQDAPVEGKPLRTTLDLGLQSEAERVLAVPDPENPGPATAIVALRPSTGAVLAAASGPGAAGLNAATFGQYAPGSTFKVVTSLALLRSGLTPASPVTCPPSVVVDGKTFSNYSDYPATALGRITLRRAVANSCNTAFIGSRDRLDEGALADAAASLGFGVDHDLGFPAYFGEVPEPRSETEAAADLIGQGTVLASPLAMATVAASVRAGRTVVPHLVAGFEPRADPATPLTRSEAQSLRELMRAVVTEGSGSFLAALPGEVGAKTGTAEYGQPGPGGDLPTHAWMIATQGDLAVAVFVETGVSGSRTAGPLLDRFLRSTRPS
jgi:cell division protein FtsI/penicillin-binding protein 2